MAKKFIAVNHLRKQKPKVKVEPVPSFNFTVQFSNDDYDPHPFNINGFTYAPYIPPYIPPHIAKLMFINKEYRIKKQMKNIHSQMCGCDKFCIMKVSHDVTISDLYMSFWSASCEQIELFKFQVQFDDECANIFQNNKEQICI